MKTLLRGTLVVSAFVADQVSAWNSETHLMIGRVAHDILMKQDPSVVTKVESLLSKFSDTETQLHEKDHSFVECVTWADDIKYRGGGWQSAWHFDDTPFIGDKSKASDLDIKYSDKNITTMMPVLYHWLKGDKDIKDTIAYTTISKYGKTENEKKSIALRLLMHYYGDIHQPLHCSDRYTKEHTQGDKGGNEFITKSHYGAKELHAVWDEVIYANHKSIKRPFTSTTWADFGDMSTELLDGVTVTTSETNTIDYKKFASESYKIAVHVYDNINESKDDPLPSAYTTK